MTFVTGAAIPIDISQNINKPLVVPKRIKG